MLALDDPRWKEMRDAYGPAQKIPGLVEKLASETVPPNTKHTEPWPSLWSALCHQGDVYTASYQAVPHIVHIAVGLKGKELLDLNFFVLPASIEIARQKGRGPELPKHLEEGYLAALKKICIFFERYIGSEDIYLNRCAQAARLMAAGDIDKADQLLDIE